MRETKKTGSNLKSPHTGGRADGRRSHLHTKRVRVLELVPVARVPACLPTKSGDTQSDQIRNESSIDLSAKAHLSY